MPFIGGGGVAVKSIQRGTTTFDSTESVTINAVDLAKSFISSSFIGGATSAVGVHYLGAYGSADDSSVGTELSDETTLLFYKGGGANHGNKSCYWEVIEYE